MSLFLKNWFFQISVIWKLKNFFVKKRYTEHTQAMKILMRVWVCFFIRQKISLSQVSRTGQEFPQTDIFQKQEGRGRRSNLWLLQIFLTFFQFQMRKFSGAVEVQNYNTDCLEIIQSLVGPKTSSEWQK